MQRKNFKTSAKKKYYIVKKGKNPGVYYNWPDCQKQVQGFPGAVYKGFVTREEAEAWYGKPVKEAWLYSFCLRKPIRIFPEIRS